MFILPEHLRAQLAGWRAAWPLWLLLALVLGLQLWPASTALLRYDRSLLGQGEWWRLLTANLVHTNGWHLLLNVSSIAVQWLLFGGLWSRRQWLLVALVCSFGNILGLHWFSPGLDWYVGLSGALYGTALAGSIALLAQREWLVGGVLFAYLNGRIVYEQFTGAPPDLSELINAPVAVDAHLWGLVCGYLAAALVLGWAAAKR